MPHLVYAAAGKSASAGHTLPLSSAVISPGSSFTAASTYWRQSTHSKGPEFVRVLVSCSQIFKLGPQEL
jgi:hypothetical protein